MSAVKTVLRFLRYGNTFQSYEIESVVSVFVLSFNGDSFAAIDPVLGDGIVCKWAMMLIFWRNLLPPFPRGPTTPEWDHSHSSYVHNSLK
jgi:hypothetical protein